MTYLDDALIGFACPLQIAGLGQCLGQAAQDCAPEEVRVIFLKIVQRLSGQGERVDGISLGQGEI